MKIKANTELGISCNVYDLDTGARLQYLDELDSEAGTVSRTLTDAGELIPGIPDADGNIIPLVERRRFRVVDTRDGSEVCRTGTSPYDVLKGMIR